MEVKHCDEPPCSSDGIKDEREVKVSEVLKWFGARDPLLTITSTVLADTLQCPHEKMVGVLNSLSSRQKIELQGPHECVYWYLTDEGRRYAAIGSPEARLVALLQSNAKGMSMDELQQKPEVVEDKDLMSIGLKNAMKLRWIELDKARKELKVVLQGPVTDVCQKCLFIIDEAHKAHAPQDCLISTLHGELGVKEDVIEKTVLQDLKKRKLLGSKKIKFYHVKRGSDFSSRLTQQVTDLTQEMILKETWKAMDFKPYNFYAAGTKPVRGSVHPLLHVLQQFTRILLNMGFEEMPTQQWVESSFWNFDALFQPQQHPARDAQDTFFLKDPAAVPFTQFPKEYAESVRDVHEKGGYGSRGWRYVWSEEEAGKNVLRTHTTACSARMLYAIGREYQKTGIFRPKRFFSIDRVFRNETLDATHLAEFHQVEGLICERGTTLAHLMGVLKTFYAKIGISNLRFKPAFNPYTEPSMEIFGFHTLLNKWIEVGNSGMFRPEMLRPMGLPEDVTVIAWGLSLERPTMIRYGIKNIRELFGHKALLGIA